MDTPTLFDPISVTPDTDVIPSWFPLPGLGVLAINAFVIRAAEPVLVDTGIAVLSDGFMDRLRRLVELEDLRWIWMTHMDADHTGSLDRILEAAPKARVVTTYLGMGKRSLVNPIPPERAYLLNPGQALDVGDRRLVAARPPSFDAPETTCLFDTKNRTLFSSDCFGALLEEPAERAAEIGAEALRDGQVKWATIDAPWLHVVDERRFASNVDAVRALEPEAVLSSHLPPAVGIFASLASHLGAARTATPWVGPDQAALMAMAGVA